MEDPTQDDDPPTLLDNAPLGAPGEELVKFYQMPSYHMWDPSVVIYFSFAVFFAMIMSDFGYGAVLALITLMVWRKMGKSDTAKRIRSMFAMISGLCMVYGVLVGSYFGFEAPVAMLNDVKVVNVNDFDAMIKLSVGIGVLHIMLANLIRAVHAFPRSNFLSYVGWMIMLASGFTMYIFGHEIFEVQATMVTGVAMVFVFSSTRPFKGWKNLILRPIDGLLGLTNLSKAFGDALSYIRLFALGLSSALLATTFNDLAAQSWEKPGVGILIGIVVLVLGHVLNLVLAIMGGLVHGLRLNFIEFTNWGLSGEGYPFQPFALKEKKQWNK
jgi:V/A-type H+-transporting ATPase subunit I